MPVRLTQEVEGLNVGDTYTGANEAYLLASGYAERDAVVDAVNGDYTGPGVANTGDADTAIADNREFDATRGPIAVDGGTPEAATNDNIVLADGSESPFANHPAQFPLEVTSVSPATGAAAGGETVTLRGFGLKDVVTVTVGGVDATGETAVSDKELTYVTPAVAAGDHDIVVTRPGGGAENTVTVVDGFTTA